MSRPIALGEPARIQRLRSKGWRAPADVVYVGHGRQWGTPCALRASIDLIAPEVRPL